MQADKASCLRYLVVICVIMFINFYRYFQFELYTDILRPIQQYPVTYIEQAIVIATICNPPKCNEKNYRNFVKSLELHGYRVSRLNVTGEFTWSRMALVYSSYAASIRPLDQLIVFTDSSDVIAQESPNILVDKYIRISQGKPILIGMEAHCSNSRKCHKLNNRETSETSRPNIKYVNGGFVMGKASEVSQLWKEVGRSYADSQLGLGFMADKYIDKIALDYNQSIVANNVHYEWIMNYNFSDNGVICKQDGIKPSFLHVLCHTCLSNDEVNGPHVYQRILNTTLKNYLPLYGR